MKGIFEVMKRSNIKAIISILCFLILGLTACSSNKETIVGKYINVYNESNYIVFNEDGSFIDNFLTTTSKGNTTISDNYIYQIDDDGLITIIDTNEYEFQDSLHEYELGWLYKNYIGSLWSGTLPTKNEDTTITCVLNDFTCKYHFKDDKTYELNTVSNNETVNTENGTYSINGDEVICTNDEGETTTFVFSDGTIYCAEYVKE